MNAKELMIGDWVFCEGQPSPSNVLIEDICHDGIWFSGEEFEGIADFDRIFPIPITSEILKKNGFEEVNVMYEDNSAQYSYGNECLGVSIWVIPNSANLVGAWKKSEDCRTCQIITELPIHYLHEFQHILRLCGITKEIVL